jgi:hypothetical protein
VRFAFGAEIRARAFRHLRDYTRDSTAKTCLNHEKHERHERKSKTFAVKRPFCSRVTRETKTNGGIILKIIFFWS